MHSALIVHASRHGATQGIAERIGEVLRAEGLEATVLPAAQQPDPTPYDAVIVGSAVYMGSWLGEGIEYLERNATTLKARQTWIFSSGPLPGSTKEQPADDDRYGGALGPADGPGSGGRKRIEAAAEQIGVRDHRLFQGAYDPTDPPKAMSERLARMLPSVKAILPEGDFREWDVIEAWAHELAAAIKAELAERVPVA
jgi:menaquinone-dependent protoporphyrinogen oxidase